MKRIKKFIKWLYESNRVRHLVGGVLIGVGSDSLYCTEYASIGIGGAMEFKDKAHGCKFDYIDLALTVLGANIGYFSKQLLLKW